MNIKGLQFKEETNWQNVFRAWEEREGTMKEWQNVAKQKGWESWRAWRSEWSKNIGAQERAWSRYFILDPLKTVPHFRVGPTQSWQKSFSPPERLKPTFAELVEKVSFNTNDKARGMLANFPEPTEFIGVLMPDGSIVLIEGHHRATVLAIASKEGKSILFGELPTIALTRFTKNDEKLLNTMLARGSTKAAYK